MVGKLSPPVGGVFTWGSVALTPAAFGCRAERGCHGACHAAGSILSRHGGGAPMVDDTAVAAEDDAGVDWQAAYERERSRADLAERKLAVIRTVVESTFDPPPC
jgi:hypothetical protein